MFPKVITVLVEAKGVDPVLPSRAIYNACLYRSINLTGVDANDISSVIGHLEAIGYGAAIFIDELDNVYSGGWGVTADSMGLKTLNQLSYIAARYSGVWSVITGSSSMLPLLVNKWIEDPRQMASFPLYNLTGSLNSTKFVRMSHALQRAETEPELRSLLQSMAIKTKDFTAHELNMLYFCTGGIPCLLVDTTSAGDTKYSASIPFALEPLLATIYKRLKTKNACLDSLNVFDNKALEQISWFELEGLCYDDVQACLQELNATSARQFSMTDVQQLIDCHAISGKVELVATLISAAPPIRFLAHIHTFPSLAASVLPTMQHLFQNSWDILYSSVER